MRFDAGAETVKYEVKDWGTDRAGCGGAKTCKNRRM